MKKKRRGKMGMKKGAVLTPQEKKRLTAILKKVLKALARRNGQFGGGQQQQPAVQEYDSGDDTGDDAEYDAGDDDDY